MSENEKLDPWPFDFADLVAHRVLAHPAVQKGGLTAIEKHTVSEVVREAVLEALHDASKGLNPKQES